MPVDKALLVAVAAFALGMAAAWGIALVPDLLAEPEVSPSASVTPSVTDDPSVELPPLPPIMRELDEADAKAGVVTVDFTLRGEGTFTVHPGTGEPDPNGGSVRWVSIAFEDGIAVDSDAAAAFIMDTLTQAQGWSAEGRVQFVQTDGVADYWIRVASPYTAAAICPDNHVAADVGPVTEATPTISPEADDAAAQYGDMNVAAVEHDEEGANPACAHDGIVVISIYDWTAGFGPFGANRTAARQYIVNHQLGHLFGQEESECTAGRAVVMDNQRENFSPECTVNPWPYPDAVPAVSGTTPAP